MNNNPLIKDTSSSTLLFCANQLAKTLHTLHNEGLVNTNSIPEKISTLPFQLLHFPPSPTQKQCDDLQQRVSLLTKLTTQLVGEHEDIVITTHTQQLDMIKNALYYELERLQKTLPQG